MKQKIPAPIVRFSVSLLAFLSMVALAPAHAQQPATRTATTDAGYINGYSAGYADGQQDMQQHAAANAHKFRIYQEADSGYTESYGTPAAYHTAFQSGFEDGYADGFNNRAPSLGVSGPAPAGATPVDPVQTARGYGYREGYNAGQADAGKGAPNSTTTNPAYQQGNIGYRDELGAADQYQLNFRSGFTTGYDDGFNHRLYNAAIGLRESSNTPAADRPLAAVLTVPEGTIIRAVLNKTISTKTSKPGDTFTVSTTLPIWVGAVAAIPAGSTINCVVKEATQANKASGNAKIQLEYDTITVPGQPPIPLTAVTSAIGARDVNQDEGTVTGPGSGAGQRAAKDAAIGGIAGGIFGGMGGLIRGGIAGAAIGTAGAIISHKKDMELREGQVLQIRLDHPLDLPAAGAGSQ